MVGWVPVQLRVEIVEKLDKLKKEFDVRGRSEVIEKLIEFYEKRRENDEQN